MNKSLIRRRAAHQPVLLALILLAAACSPAAQREATTASSEEPPLAGATIGGEFVLTDQDGQSFDSATLDGKYRIVYFGYTYCPDVCPIDLQVIMAGFRQFEREFPERGAKIQPLFVTIDPERDTPAVMKQYAAAFHPRLVGLTGTPDEIAEVAADYLIVYGKHDSEGMSEYLVDHSRQAYLFGPDGAPLALLPYDGTPDEVAAEIARWTT